ncbi:hypothetical protein BRARA_G00142 [Brassica rapa]|uniref:Uncharacterized protein n=1 Tax=Brassica campestris TaxID=3711 RepID=A0A397YRV1_BRACM|nr:hypothetical protein BRARA_G00142 [Brassica rapa]
MDKISAIKAEAAPAVNKQKDNSIEKERSDTKEIIEGLADRLQKMEEKMDLLISLINSNSEASVSVKTRSVKAERESYEEPCKKKAKTDAKTQTKESTSDDSSEESDENKSDSRLFSARGRGRGRGRGRPGLYAGGPYAGGRCGGAGFCGKC